MVWWLLSDSSIDGKVNVLCCLLLQSYLCGVRNLLSDLLQAQVTSNQDIYYIKITLKNQVEPVRIYVEAFIFVCKLCWHLFQSSTLNVCCSPCQLAFFDSGVAQEQLPGIESSMKTFWLASREKHVLSKLNCYNTTSICKLCLPSIFNDLGYRSARSVSKINLRKPWSRRIRRRRRIEKAPTSPSTEGSSHLVAWRIERWATRTTAIALLHLSASDFSVWAWSTVPESPNPFEPLGFQVPSEKVLFEVY